MGTAGASLLLVEDDEDTREALATLFGEEGFRVTSIEDAELALEHMRRNFVAAVVLDLQLPGMPGLDLIHAVRSDPVLKDTPIVVMTGTKAAAVPAGIPVLLKPFDFVELLELARMYCATPRASGSDQGRFSWCPPNS